MFDWLRRVWGRRQELSLLEREPIRLLPASVVSSVPAIPGKGDPENTISRTVDPALAATPPQSGTVEIVPDIVTLAPPTEDHHPEILPPLETQSTVPFAVQPIEEKSTYGRARESSHLPAGESIAFVGRAVIITPPPVRKPALPDEATSAAVETPPPAAFKSSLEWRDSSYFQPGAYALRWGVQTTLCLPSSGPPLRSLAVTRTFATIQTPTPTATAPKKSELFSFLPRANPDSPRDGLPVDPATLTEFLLTREEEVAPETALYWTDTPLLARTQAVMKDLLARRGDGFAPITPQEMLEMASVGRADAMALLVCHNVSRAFARGSTALQWRATDPARGLYRKSEETFRAARAREPIFYEIFDPESLLALDPGDWYRFFGAAAATAFAAGDKLSPVFTANFPPLVEAVDRIARQLLALHDDSETSAPSMATPSLAGSSLAGSGPTAALAWVNAMQFWERGLFCPSEETIRRSAAQGLRGFTLGLECAGIKVRKRWMWQLPMPLSLVQEELQKVDAVRMILGVENSVVAT